MKFLKAIGHLLIILFLTALTQVGGIIWIFSLMLSKLLNRKKRHVFPLLYLSFNLFIIPPIAKQFGRENLPVFSKELKPRNWVYPLLFRNYVNSNLKNELENAAHSLFKFGVSMTYLDANFPFIDGFPLLPHLSHNDGKKIDIAFLYIDENGNSTTKKPSVSGYGVYSNSDKNHTLKPCLNKGYWQYDFSRYLTFGTIHNLSLDKQKTAILIKELLSIKSTQKLFIEPHLKNALGFSKENRIRFHGCQAVRHDDHIHLQIK